MAPKRKRLPTESEQVVETLRTVALNYSELNSVCDRAIRLIQLADYWKTACLALRKRVIENARAAGKK
jgi:hypothetical protein